jgi:hypothetical protein
MPGSLAPELMRRSEEMLGEAVDVGREAADRIEALEAFANEVISRCKAAGIPGHEFATLARAALPHP